MQLPLLVGNLVVDFAGTLCLKHKITLSSNDGTESNDAGHSTSRLVQATKCFTKDGWSQKVGLPPKYHTTLQDLPVYIGERNQHAHRTERQLARILLSPQLRDKHARYHRGGLYPFCYGKTIEEVASESETLWMPEGKGTDT